MRNQQKKPMTLASRGLLESLVFCLPWLVGFLLFFLYPLLSSVQLSFSSITSLKNYTMSWVGLQNYTDVLFMNTEFLPILGQSAWNTCIQIPCIVFLSMIFAILLNDKIQGKGFFRTIFFLPVLLGTGYVMQQLVGGGTMADGQTAVEVVRGIAVPEQLTRMLDPQFAQIISALFGNITMILWKSGVQIIIFLAGLQSIPQSVYESAKIDSASAWETFWKITMPMLAPITVLNLVYTIVDSFTDLSNPVIQYILNQSKEQARFGQASAMSWLYLLFVIIIMAIVFFFSRKHTDGVYAK